jgi:hypothetical protein
MQDSNDIKNLLAEIRDTQLEHLAEYRKVTERSLELQQKAVNRQEQMSKLYRLVLTVGSLLIVAVIFILIYVLRFLR